MPGPRDSPAACPAADGLGDCPVLPVPYAAALKQALGTRVVKSPRRFEQPFSCAELQAIVEEAVSRTGDSSAVVREVGPKRGLTSLDKFSAAEANCGASVMLSPGAPPLKPQPACEKVSVPPLVEQDEAAYPQDGYPLLRNTPGSSTYDELAYGTRDKRHCTMNEWVTRWHTAAAQKTTTAKQERKRTADLQELLAAFTKVAVKAAVHLVRTKTPARDVADEETPGWDARGTLHSGEIREGAFSSVRKSLAALSISDLPRAHGGSAASSPRGSAASPRHGTSPRSRRSTLTPAEKARQRLNSAVAKVDLGSTSSVDPRLRHSASEPAFAGKQYFAPSGNFEVDGVVVTFAASPEKMRLLGSHEGAMKTMALKHAGLDALFSTDTRNMGLYPYVTVTYLGHRMLVRPLLPVATGKIMYEHAVLTTLCRKLNLKPHWTRTQTEEDAAAAAAAATGGDETTMSGEYSVAEEDDLLGSSAAEADLASYASGTASESFERERLDAARYVAAGPRGLCAVKSAVDNRVYLVGGTARLFPAVPWDHSQAPNSYVYRRLRREMVLVSCDRKGRPMQLSADGCSPFGSSKRDEHDTEVALTADAMRTGQIHHALNELILHSVRNTPTGTTPFDPSHYLLPQQAGAAPSSTAAAAEPAGGGCSAAAAAASRGSPTECFLARAFHSRGVNLRYLGLAYQFLMARLRRAKVTTGVPLELFDLRAQQLPRGTRFIPHVEALATTLRTEMVTRCVKDIVHDAMRMGGGHLISEVVEVLFGDDKSFEGQEERNAFFFELIVPRLEEKFGKRQGANIEKYHFDIDDVSISTVYNKLLQLTGLRLQRAGVSIDRHVESKYFTKGLAVGTAVPLVRLPVLPVVARPEGESDALVRQAFAMLRAASPLADSLDLGALSEMVDDALRFLNELFPGARDPTLLFWQRTRDEQISYERARNEHRQVLRRNQLLAQERLQHKYANEAALESIEYLKKPTGILVEFDVRRNYLHAKWGLYPGTRIQFEWPAIRDTDASPPPPPGAADASSSAASERTPFSPLLPALPEAQPQQRAQQRSSTYTGVVVGERSGWLWRVTWGEFSEGAVAFNARNQAELLQRYRVRPVECAEATPLRTLIKQGEHLQSHHQKQLKDQEALETEWMRKRKDMVSSTETPDSTPPPSPTGQRGQPPPPPPVSSANGGKGVSEEVSYVLDGELVTFNTSMFYLTQRHGLRHGDVVLLSSGRHRGRIGVALGVREGRLYLVDSVTGLPFRCPPTSHAARVLLGRRRLAVDFGRYGEGSEDSNLRACEKLRLFPRHRVVLTRGSHAGAVAVVLCVRTQLVVLRLEVSRSVVTIAPDTPTTEVILKKFFGPRTIGFADFLVRASSEDFALPDAAAAAAAPSSPAPILPSLSGSVSHVGAAAAAAAASPSPPAARRGGSLSRLRVLDWKGGIVAVDACSSRIRECGGTVLGQVLRVVEGRWLLRAVVVTGVRECPGTGEPCLWGVVDGYKGSVPLAGCSLVQTPDRREVMVYAGRASKGDAPPRTVTTPFRDVVPTEPFPYLTYYGALVFFDVAPAVLTFRYGFHHGQLVVFGAKNAPASIGAVVGVYRNEVWVSRVGTLRAEPLPGRNARALAKKLHIEVIGMSQLHPFQDSLRVGESPVTHGTDVTSAEAAGSYPYMTNDYELIGLSHAKALLRLWGGGFDVGDVVERVSRNYVTTQRRWRVGSRRGRRRRRRSPPRGGFEEFLLAEAEGKAREEEGREALRLRQVQERAQADAGYATGIDVEWVWKRDSVCATVVGVAHGRLYLHFEDDDGAVPVGDVKEFCRAKGSEGGAELRMRPISEAARRTALQARVDAERASRDQSQRVQEEASARLFTQEEVVPHLKLVKVAEMVSVAKRFEQFPVTALRRVLEVALQRSGLDLLPGEGECCGLRKLAVLRCVFSVRPDIPTLEEYEAFAAGKDHAPSLIAYVQRFTCNAARRANARGAGLVVGGQVLRHGEEDDESVPAAAEAAEAAAAALPSHQNFHEVAARKMNQVRTLKKLRLKETAAKRLTRVRNEEHVRSLQIEFQTKAGKQQKFSRAGQAGAGVAGVGQQRSDYSAKLERKKVKAQEGEDDRIRGMRKPRTSICSVSERIEWVTDLVLHDDTADVSPVSPRPASPSSPRSPATAACLALQHKAPADGLAARDGSSRDSGAGNGHDSDDSSSASAFCGGEAADPAQPCDELATATLLLHPAGPQQSHQHLHNRSHAHRVSVSAAGKASASASAHVAARRSEAAVLWECQPHDLPASFPPPATLCADAIGEMGEAAAVVAAAEASSQYARYAKLLFFAPPEMLPPTMDALVADRPAATLRSSTEGDHDDDNAGRAVPPPLMSALPALEDRLTYVLRSGEVICFDTSSRVERDWGHAAHSVVRYTKGDLAGLTATVLGVHRGMLWRRDQVPGSGRAAPFAGDAAQVRREHGLEAVDCPPPPVATADPFVFPLWDTALAVFDISADACRTFGVRHGERYACGVSPPLAETAALCHPELTPFILTIIGVHNAALWYCLQDRTGAVFFSGSNIVEEYSLVPLYTTSVEEVAIDSERVLAYLGGLTLDSQLPVPTVAAGGTGPRRPSGRWGPLLFESTHTSFERLGCPHLQHRLRVRHTVWGVHGVVVGTARFYVWVHFDGDQGATVVHPQELPFLQPCHVSEKPKVPELVRLLPCKPRQSPAGSVAFRYHTTAGNVALFDTSAAAVEEFGVRHGEVVAFRTGSVESTAVIVGVRQGVLWKVAHGTSGATPFTGVKTAEGLQEHFALRRTERVEKLPFFHG